MDTGPVDAVEQHLHDDDSERIPDDAGQRAVLSIMLRKRATAPYRWDRMSVDMDEEGVRAALEALHDDQLVIQSGDGYALNEDHPVVSRMLDAYIERVMYEQYGDDILK